MSCLCKPTYSSVMARRMVEKWSLCQLADTQKLNFFFLAKLVRQCLWLLPVGVFQICFTLTGKDIMSFSHGDLGNRNYKLLVIQTI